MPLKIVQYLGTGRRKTAVARIFLRPGKGDMTVNGRPLENYFPTEASRGAVKQALLATETADKIERFLVSVRLCELCGQRRLPARQTEKGRRRETPLANWRARWRGPRSDRHRTGTAEG